jgi:aryl-alcohol dehydrogenase-like predicted oxidoreductase
MGILTGKFDPDTQFGEGDWRSRWQNNPEEREIYRDDLAKVEQLRELAAERTLAQLALQFAMAHPAVSTVIPGGKNINQVSENVAAALFPALSAEERAQIDAITPPGGGRKIWPA